MDLVDQATMEDGENSIMRRLQAHVQTLAGDIGERNIWHPAALNDATQYISSNGAARATTDVPSIQRFLLKP